MSTEQQSLAFFGATGGCAATTLALCLKANFKCTALVRTPSKLQKLLETEHQVSSATIEEYLTVAQGNITDEAAVKTALTTGGRLPDKVLFGVGATPKLQWSLFTPVTLDQPTICNDGMATVVAALRSLQQANTPLGFSGKKPVVASISTTGVSRTRDVPFALYALYHWLLSVPHEDKKNMEKQLVDAAYEEDSPLSSFAVVRPTLLTDGQIRGVDGVRAGWVWADGKEGTGPAAGPAMGYYISRADVGNWIFERIMSGGDEWANKCATLTY